MSARFVADEAALREALAHALWDAQGPEAVDYTHTEHLADAQLDALLASGVVQPREDAEREALLQAADDIDRQVLAAPYSGASLGPWLRDRAAALAPTDATTQGGES